MMILSLLFLLNAIIFGTNAYLSNRKFINKFKRRTDGLFELNVRKGFGKSTSESLTSTSTQQEVRKKGKVDLEKYCKNFDMNYKGLRILHSDPPVFEIDNFFSEEICDELILLAQNKGVQISSQTFSPLTSAMRTSTTWFINYSDIPMLLDGANRVTSYPITTYEEPQIVRYEMGQQFSWHYDTIPKSILDSSGQRRVTILVYLNTVSDGSGATAFKDLNIKVQPVKGKALIFFPSFADGTPDERTTHAGQLALDTKWVAQMWIHEHDYNSKFFSALGGQVAGIAAVEEYRNKNKN